MKKITVQDRNTLQAGGLVSTDIPSTATVAKTPYLLKEATWMNGVPAPATTAAAATEKLTVTILHPTRELNRPFMHTKMAEKATALNDQIERYAARMAPHLGLASSEEFANPFLSAKDKVTIVGRIIKNDEAANTQNHDSFLLESSREMGSGGRIPLDLSACACSFFPGQIVALDGKRIALSEGGSPRFFVQKQHSINLMSPSNDAPKMCTTRNLSILLAAGPFDIPTNPNSWGSFEKLLNFANETKPDLLLLSGPFLSYEFSSSDATMAAEEVFEKQFIGRLSILLDALPALKAFLIPSTNDLVADPILPQPPLCSGRISAKIQSLPNPSVFSVGGINIAICSQDAAFPLGLQAFNSRNDHIDRVAHLCQYLHQQASFFPLTPAPLGTNIDYTLFAELEMPPPSLPLHLWFTPSQINCFVRHIHGTTFVNPGNFTKRQSVSGTASLIRCAGPACRVDFYQF